MIDERTEELASLHAFDLLDGADQRAFTDRLAHDAELQALVRDLRATAGTLAFTAPFALPPPALKARLLEKIGAPAATGRVVPFRLPAWIPWALAAGFAFAAAWLGRSLLDRREETGVLRTEAQLAQLALRDAENHLKAERIVLNQQVRDTGEQLADVQRQLADTRGLLAAADRNAAALGQQLKSEGDLAQLRIAALTSMLGNSPQALAVAVWNPARQEGVFAVDKLPAAAADQDYELWVIDPQQAKPISGGVFTVGADGQARVQFKTEAPVAAIAKFAVSREKKGGAPRLSGPQGTVIMISQ